MTTKPTGNLQLFIAELPNLLRSASIDELIVMFAEMCRARGAWKGKSDQYWLIQLAEEFGELVLAINGKHDHPMELELTEIASICINWLHEMRRTGRLGPSQEEKDTAVPVEHSYGSNKLFKETK